MNLEKLNLSVFATFQGIRKLWMLCDGLRMDSFWLLLILVCTYKDLVTFKTLTKPPFFYRWCHSYHKIFRYRGCARSLWRRNHFSRKLVSMWNSERSFRGRRWTIVVTMLQILDLMFNRQFSYYFWCQKSRENQNADWSQRLG